MACNEVESYRKNYIVDAVKSIDRMQKETVLDRLSDCITCETSLITRAYNTVPVILYCRCEPFEAQILGTGTTNIFRIECIREDRFVTLRLLTYDNGTYTCTDQTVIFDLECCCGLECFEPTNCNQCSAG